jgi:hypothetical protein
MARTFSTATKKRPAKSKQGKDNLDCSTAKDNNITPAGLVPQPNSDLTESSTIPQQKEMFECRIQDSDFNISDGEDNNNSIVDNMHGGQRLSETPPSNGPSINNPSISMDRIVNERNSLPNVITLNTHNESHMGDTNDAGRSPVNEIQQLLEQNRILQEKLILEREKRLQVVQQQRGNQSVQRLGSSVNMEGNGFRVQKLTTMQSIAFQSYIKLNIWPSLKFVNEDLFQRKPKVLAKCCTSLGFTTLGEQAAFRSHVIAKLKYVLAQTRSYYVKILREVVIGKFSNIMVINASQFYLHCMTSSFIYTMIFWLLL